METLREAYRRFVEVAQTLGAETGPPSRSEWLAELVMAHVAVNNALLAEVTEKVIAGESADYDNASAADDARLRATVEDASGWAGLVELVRERGERLSELAEQLTPEQAGTLVHTKIVDGLKLRLDEPMPWSRVLEINGRVHVVSHTDRLLAMAR